MRGKLTRIGNTWVVRLPKAVIEEAGLQHDLDLEVVNGAVVIRSSGVLRAGWAQAAAACHQAREDQLDDWDVATGDGRRKLW